MNMYNILKIKPVFLFLSCYLFVPSVFAEDVDAVLHWSKRVELTTAVDGVVSKVFSGTGKIAAKGEVLVQLDSRIFQADLKHKKANLEHAVVQREEAKRELDRQTDMYDRTMLSEHELQLAKNNYEHANAVYHKAQSELTMAKIRLHLTAVRAPFNAVVVDNHAVKGMVVTSDVTPDMLVTLAEANRMIARGYVVAAKINTLVLGQGATVTIAGTNYNGKIARLAMEQDKKKPGLYAVDIIFEAKDLRAGQLAKISL